MVTMEIVNVNTASATFSRRNLIIVGPSSAPPLNDRHRPKKKRGNGFTKAIDAGALSQFCRSPFGAPLRAKRPEKARQCWGFVAPSKAPRSWGTLLFRLLKSGIQPVRDRGDLKSRPSTKEMPSLMFLSANTLMRRDFSSDTRCQP